MASCEFRALGQLGWTAFISSFLKTVTENLVWPQRPCETALKVGHSNKFRTVHVLFLFCPPAPLNKDVNRAKAQVVPL